MFIENNKVKLLQIVINGDLSRADLGHAPSQLIISFALSH